MFCDVVYEGLINCDEEFFIFLKEFLRSKCKVDSYILVFL